MHEALIDRIRDKISLKDSESATIKELFIKEELKAGEYLLKEGDICRKFWFIEKGLLHFSILLDGEVKAFVFRKENDFATDMESFLRKSPANKNIVAIEDCILYSITDKNLQRFYNEIEEGNRFGRLLIEDTFIGTVLHFIAYISKSPQERYIEFLHENKDIVQRVPQYLIASELGIKPQSLSRIRRKLATQSIY